MEKLLFENSQTTKAPTRPDMDTQTEHAVASLNASTTSYDLGHLSHFSTYVISIRACREDHVKDSANPATHTCSLDVHLVARTLEDGKADLVEDFAVHSLPSNGSNHNSVLLQWKPPVDPNGRVLNYIVKTQKVGDKEFENTCIQVTNRQNVSSQVIPVVSPGNHSVQFAAYTMAGVGNFTKVKYFNVDSPHGSVFTSGSFLFLMLLIVSAAIGVGIYRVYQKRHPHQETMRRLDNFDSEFIE